MSKFKRYRLIGLLCLMGMIFYGWVGFSQPPQPSVQLTTIPFVQHIRPFEAESKELQSPVQFTLKAVDARGQRLQQANIHLQLLTQPQNPWFPTDFPVVEGTTLLDMEAVAPKGELTFQQMLPIRGTYKLLVKVTPIAPNAFSPIQQTLTLSVSENGVKYRNFSILAVILWVVGLRGGWVIGRQQPLQPGEIAPQRVRLLLSGMILVAIATLLYVNISAELAQSHHSMAMSHGTEMPPPTEHPAQLRSQGLDLKLSGDPSATVGQLATFQASVKDTKTNQPVTDVLLKITATQQEDRWVSFAYTGYPDSTGTLSWRQQFFDGAPHQVDVAVVPQTQANRTLKTFQVSQAIPVEGIAPPLQIRLIVLAYMTGIVVLGFLLGFGLRRQQLRRMKLMA